MKKKSLPASGKTILMISNGLCSLLILFLSVTFFSCLNSGFTGWINPKGKFLLVLIYFFLAVLYFIRALSAGKNVKRDYIRNLIHTGIFLLCGILILFIPYSQTLVWTTSILHAGVYITDRIFSVINNHSIRNCVVNLICVVVVVYCLLEIPLFLCSIIVILQMMLNIMCISFSNVKLKILRNVIRKTYAAEILFGLGLLVIAFSLVLPGLEDAIHGFWDAMWYCFSLITTIGFGDVTAVTGLGRILSVILGIYGIIVVALVTSIIVSFYNETRKEKDNDEPEEDEEKEEEK